MWKYIVVGIMAAVLFLSLAAWADTGDEATATLILTDVINTEVTWGASLEITQHGEGGTEAMDAWTTGTMLDFGTLSVKVTALTQYTAWGCYWASGGDLATYPFGDNAQLLDVSPNGSPAVYDGYLPYNSTFETLLAKDYTGPYIAPGLVTLFAGNNNAPSGETGTFDVTLNPASLGDRTSGETITFTIVVVVEDPTL